jgi:hypothetical protein
MPGEASYTQALITRLLQRGTKGSTMSRKRALQLKKLKKKGPILAEEHCVSNIEHLVEME